MKADVLDAIRITLREEGGLTESAVLQRYRGTAHRSTVGRGIKEFKRFQAKRERNLRGNPITNRPVPWELQAVRAATGGRLRVSEDAG